MGLLDEGLAPGHLLQKLYRDMGHDGIIMSNADKEFRGLSMGGGTEHHVLWGPELIRRAEAAFDPAKIDSSNLLSANPLTAAIPGLFATNRLSQQ